MNISVGGNMIYYVMVQYTNKKRDVLIAKELPEKFEGVIKFSDGNTDYYINMNNVNKIEVIAR